MSIEVRRFDRSAITVTKRDDGAISGEAVITKAGVFCYRQPDGSIRREFRPPAEVFKADSMASAQMLPITDGHPTEFVTLENAKALSVGFTGERVRADGNNLVASLNINTKEGISAIDKGRKELSLGYKVKVDEGAGVWEGVEYTHVQSDIGYNHLALVEEGRAGHVASLRLDAVDAVMADVKTDVRKENVRMAKVRLDGNLEYDCAAEVQVALEKLRKDHSDAVASVTALTKERDTLTAERDELKVRVDTAEKVDHSAAIAEGIKTRIDVVGKATKILPEDEVKKLDDMSVDEIKAAAIKAKYPELDLAGKSADYVAARFDAIAESAGDGAGAAQANGDKIIGDSSKKRKDSAVDSDQKREDAVAAMKARSLGEEVKAK